MRRRIAGRLARPLLLLAASTWIGLGAQLVDMGLAGAELAPYHFAQGALVLAGLAGCALRSRGLLIGAAAAYLVLAVVRLFVVYTWKFLDTDPWQVAAWNTFALQWLLVQHFLSDGWVSSAVSMVFYEWLMPLAQGVILAWLIIRRTSHS